MKTATKAWIQTFTGKKIHPFALKPEDIDVLDIANALAMKCRFTGMTREFYSIAQHSLHVAEQVSEPWKLEALLHDAAEAYLSDIASPVKPFYEINTSFVSYEEGIPYFVDSMTTFAQMEEQVLRVIYEGLHLPEFKGMSGIVRDADLAMLLAEQEQLLGPQAAPWGIVGVPANVMIRPWHPSSTRFLFIEKYAEYSKLSKEDEQLLWRKLLNKN